MARSLTLTEQLLAHAALLLVSACSSRSVAPGPGDAGPKAPAAAAAVAPGQGLGVAPADEARIDVLVRGGRVVDPANHRDGLFDVAIANGRVVAVAESIDPTRAAKVIDATGRIVTPGFVDLHTHVFFGSERNRYLARTSLALVPDDFAPKSCTTTVVDAGSSGHKSFAAFESAAVSTSKTRVLAFLNIVGEGMRGGRYEQDLDDMDAGATAAAIAAHAGVVVGVKVAHYAGPGWEPIERAREAAKATGTRVMVDFGGHVPELSLEELLLERLAPGDIFTHAFAHVRGRTSIVDAGGALRPYVQRARERGVLFDVGYGAKSFSFEQAGPALELGFLPDTISSDAHRSSVRGSMHDLVAIVSKLDALGAARGHALDVSELVARVTARPAAAIGRPSLGALSPGAEGDVAILALTEGTFRWKDVDGREITGSRELSCELTLRAGEVVWDAHGRASPRR